MTFVKRPQPREKKRQTRIGLAIFLGICVMLSSFLSFRKAEDILDRHKIHTIEKDKDAHQQPLSKVEVLKHEGLFHQTIKSCLPATNKNCKLYVPEKTKAQRVAVMAPPGDFGLNFYRLLQTIVARARTIQQIDIELIPTNHVPPYGYGNTHGLTKIIRLIPNPFVLGATNTLDFFRKEGDTIDNITLDDIKSSLRLQMRYHCRLSHVAAHTALMSIQIDKRLLDASLDSLIKELQIFLGIELIGLSEEVLSLDKTVGGSLVTAPKPLGSIFDGMLQQCATLLTHYKMTSIGNMYEELDKVLLEELRVSNNMKRWPCESFWTVGSQDPLNLSPLVSRIAESMSPDCLANFSSCWVKRDHCESKRDGKCI